MSDSGLASSQSTTKVEHESKESPQESPYVYCYWHARTQSYMTSLSKLHRGWLLANRLKRPHRIRNVTGGNWTWGRAGSSHTQVSGADCRAIKESRRKEFQLNNINPYPRFERKLDAYMDVGTILSRWGSVLESGMRVSEI